MSVPIPQAAFSHKENSGKPAPPCFMCHWCKVCLKCTPLIHSFLQHTHTHRTACRWRECFHATERVCELFTVLKDVPRIPGKEPREVDGQHMTFSVPYFSFEWLFFPFRPSSSVSHVGLYSFCTDC